MVALPSFSRRLQVKMKQITSTDNALYKSIRRLASSPRARREERRIVLDGVHLVRAYLGRFGPDAVELVIRKSAAGHPEIVALAEQAKSAIMTDSLFDKLSPATSPVGIVALAPLPELPIPTGRSFDAVLDGIQDPGNLGAILRSAAAAGARQAHLSTDCADPWSPKCLRGGMGAQLLIAVQQHDNLASAARNLGSRLIACTVDAPVSLFEADLDGDVAFVLGGEGAGISQELLAMTQQRIRVPMRAGLESLNVGAAAAICFYEWVRRGDC
jgi:RNA methyltransferase, TrmH family